MSIKISGLTLNKEKCKFKITSVEFLGQTITSEGITASSNKVKTVTEIKATTNSKKLNRFLGMVD